MKALLLLLTLLLPLRQEVELDLLIPQEAAALFTDYANANFRQQVEHTPAGNRIRVRGHTHFRLELRTPLRPDPWVLARQPREVQAVARRLLARCVDLGSFLDEMRSFLHRTIAYSDKPLPQDPASVMRNRRAHCVGFANLTLALLRTAGVNCRPVRGFYLSQEEGGRIAPTSHRWLEIEVRPGVRFFFDPQYQNFSSRYLLLAGDTPFERIERFSLRLLDKDVQWIDQ